MQINGINSIVIAVLISLAQYLISIKIDYFYETQIQCEANKRDELLRMIRFQNILYKMDDTTIVFICRFTLESGFVETIFCFVYFLVWMVGAYGIEYVTWCC